MKKALALAACMVFLVSTLHAAVTIRFENKDSKTHKMEVKISGSKKTVEFAGSRTASVTIQGGSTECVISTDCGDVTVKDGDRITIKDGCIEVE